MFQRRGFFVAVRACAEASMVEISEEVGRMHLSRLNAAWRRLTFRTFLLKNAYTSESRQALVARSHIGSGVIVRDGVGFHLHLTHAPQ